MKRIIVLSIIITLVLSIIFGGVSAEEKNNSESRDFNALIMCSQYWNQPNETRVFSVEDLNNYIYENYYNDTTIKFDVNKYDETFFKDKFLCFYHVTNVADSKLEISSVSETTDSVEVEISKYDLYAPSDYVAWILVLEMDRTLSNKEVSVTTVTTEFMPKSTPEPLDGVNASLIVGVNDHSRPQSVKVFSVEELDNYINEYHYNNIPLYFDRNKYDASFFEDKLLYFTLVTITGGSPKLEITSLSETTGAIDVEVTIPRWPLTTPDAASWILVLEMDRTKMDKEVSVTTVQQKIQSVGVADNNFIIELNGLIFEGEILFAAVYDTNGRLLTMSQPAAETENRSVYDVNFDAQATGAKIIKVMWWSGLNTMQPLCQSATVIKEGDNWIMKE